MKRIPIVLTALLVLSGFFHYHLEVFRTESTYGFYRNQSSRLKLLFEQVDDKGSLVRSAGGTYTPRQVDSGNKDCGIHILLANLSLFKTPVYEDVLRIQYYVFMLGIILMYLPSIPLTLSVAGSFGFLFAMFLGGTEWEMWGYWPPSLAVVLVLLLISMSQRSLWQMCLVAGYVGCLGILRRDCVFIGVIPLVGMGAWKVVERRRG